MRRLAAIFDRYTFSAILLALGVGWILWHVRLEDYRPAKEVAKDSRVVRWWHSYVWPPDGRPGFGPPGSGNPGDALRFKSYDWMFLLRQRLQSNPPPREAVMVLMDEESHEKFQQALNEPWDRRLHARLLNRAIAAGARAVVFDVVFAEQKRFSDAEGDRIFAEAVAAASNRVVVAVSQKLSKEPGRAPGVVPPFRALRQAIARGSRPEIVEWNLYQGLPELFPSYDEVVRMHPPSFPPFKHSLGWATASVVGAPLAGNPGSDAWSAAETAERWLNYYGPGLFLDVMHYESALDPALPDERFKDRIVYVGSGTLTKFSGERKDSYISPFAALGRDEERFIAGAEIQTTAALNLVRGDWLVRANVRTELVAFLLVGLFAAILLQRLQGFLATLGALAMAAGIVAFAYHRFVHDHVWFAWLIPIAQVGAAWFHSITVNSFRLFIQNQLYQRSLALYLSPKLVKKFAADKEQKFLKPGAEKTELTVFFSDIAGFTSISEGLDSDDLALTMNAYFETAVGQCIHPTDGTVVKYIGDAIFAFWNAPDPQPDHADRACDAALRFRQQTIQEVNGHKLITRIGLHSGVANVGNFGSTQRVDYTALGENINLASRMEGLNKYLGTETLMTGDVHALVAGRFLTRFLGRFILKGFEKGVEVHELLGRPDRAPEFRELHDAFAAAVARVRACDVEGAAIAFEALHARFPNDGPTRFYVKAIAEMRGHPPGPGWDGSVELKEK